MKNTSKKRVISLCIILLTILVISAVVVVYVNDYYRALDIVSYSLEDSSEVDVVIDDGMISFVPSSPAAGLIFYPGGKVEYESYVPLMKECAENGLLCIIVKMPCNLAVLDINAADGLTDMYPDVDAWYIGGHSLGGAMAASYASKHSDDLDGLVLLAAYSTSDLSETVLSVLEVYGSEDGVMNRNKYEKYYSNLPDDFSEIIIDGGCHAFFGCYGPQKGDGTPSITNEEQISITANAIADFVNDRR